MENSKDNKNVKEKKELEKLKELKNKLEYNLENGWEKVHKNPKMYKYMEEFTEKYIEFLNNSKTERKATKEIIKILEENGFKEISKLDKVKYGDKIYFNNDNKSVYAIKVNESLLKGINILGSHIDSPRIDVKSNPLYEDSELALFKTHYYGGIKKYQWTTIPLTLTGVITKKGGEVIEVNIGDDLKDPVFVISDLLPHLAKDQMQQNASKVVNAKNLNVLVGSKKLPEIASGIKLNVLKLLNEKYGIVEKDLIASELTFVPAASARKLGFDESMVLGYGQDDKVCAYTSLIAFVENKSKKNTAVIFSDKEEVGSLGRTGMESELFDTFLIEILYKLGEKQIFLGKVYQNSNILSADVNAAVDPSYLGAFEPSNNSYMNKGVVLSKFTGGGGKYDSSDASAEFLRKVIDIFETNDVLYQVSELGEVDQGGGGTIAFILANKGANVIDCGIGLLSMHAPQEISSEFDVFEMYRGFKAFLDEA